MNALPMLAMLAGALVFAWVFTSIQMDFPAWKRAAAVAMQYAERVLLWLSRHLPEPWATKAWRLSEQVDVRNHHWAAEAVAETCAGCLYRASTTRHYDWRVDGL